MLLLQRGMKCLTLLSDLGLTDASVAIAKGILIQYTTNVSIIDISHTVAPYHLQQAAYLLANAFRHFPSGTIHVVLFDVFSEKEPRMILCEQDGQYFIAPDNGVLSLAVDPYHKPTWNGLDAGKDKQFVHWLHRAGEIIALIQRNEHTQLTECEMKHAPLHWLPSINEDGLECHVIHIDHFGTVVLNITETQFESARKGRRFYIEFARKERVSEVSHHFSDLTPGSKLCRFNAAGYLEIGVSQGDAAGLFGLRLYQQHHLIYNTIKIRFV